MMTANAADEDWNLLLPFFSPDWRELAKVTEALKEQYRFRWQIELVFKRFKQIAQLGHLPEYDEDSAHARLYGKLFVSSAQGGRRFRPAFVPSCRARDQAHAARLRRYFPLGRGRHFMTPCSTKSSKNVWFPAVVGAIPEA